MKDILPLPTLHIEKVHFRLEGNPSVFNAELNCEELEPGVHLIHVKLNANSPVTPKPLKLSWSIPIVDIKAMWNSACDSKRWLSRPWEITVQSQATKDAPVISLYNHSGTNRLTFACSDALNHIESTAAIKEETAALSCSLTFFAHPTAPLSQYQVTLRLDQRACPYHQSLNDVQEWWASKLGITPSFVPDIARLPVYSTWYSFHKELTSAEVENQCRLAKEYGCETVIIDDGWQTEDNKDGYAYCGDWEVCKAKFPDMSAHIARLHEMGIKSLLWFSVPFIGFKSQAYPRFKGKYLFEMQNLNAFSMDATVLDPRFPEVREYLINLYENAIRDWDFDGLKLDFVDQFAPTAANYQDDATGRDINSVPEAVDRLLRDTMARLSIIKPNVLIEFRQAYIGPLMRSYGNLFRAGDCPNDAVCNRVRTIDIRLLAGTTATHSDMLMWSSEEPVESAALHFLNILFSVPQISVLLHKIPKSHQQMLRFWIGLWKELRDTLLDGTLEPYYPDLQYPFVLAKKPQRWVGAVYADIVAPLSGRLPEELYLINATHQKRIVLDLNIDSGFYQIEESNVLGDLVDVRTQSFSIGIHALKVPPSGFLRLKKA